MRWRAVRWRAVRWRAVALTCLLSACGSSTGTSEDQGLTQQTPATVTTTPGGSSTSAAGPEVETNDDQNTATSNTATSNPPTSRTTAPASDPVRTGAAILVADDFGDLAGMRVGIIVNQTSVVEGHHLIDLVQASEAVTLAAVFSPEHGVRGSADAGELVVDSVDPTTGAPIHSLYGNNRQPTAAMLADVDVLVYDLQDVGTRFYTYISTMGLAMQAAADAGIPFVVLDRPNPQGGELVAGFTRQPGLESFVSQYPIPSVYGLTAGELATAIQREGWLEGLAELDLSVVEMEGWVRNQRWPDTELDWIPPSPGLPSSEAALIYPGTVLFEATTLSYGKGTAYPFTSIGAPWVNGQVVADELNAQRLPGVRFEPISFVPDPALAPDPRHSGEQLEGVRIVLTDTETFQPVQTGLHLLAAFRDHADDVGAGAIVDRRPMFNLLAGNDRLLRLFDTGVTVDEMAAAWADDVEAFQALRQAYLRY